MTRENARKQLMHILAFLNPQLDGADTNALNTAIDTLDLISHLKDRPCDACEFKVDGNCQKWACVFDEAIFGKGAGLNV